MAWIKPNATLAGLISLGVLAIILISCTSPSSSVPTSSPSPLPRAVSKPPNTAISKPTQPTAPQNPLPELPLNLGATWVYSDVVYSGNNPQDIFTSTYIYTDVVIHVRLVSPHFAAEISRTASLIEGKQPLFAAPEAETWWYVISGTQVYRQPVDKLDLSSISSSWLEYSFPLTQSAWYPDPEIRKNVSPDSMASGIRYTFPESEIVVPAGLFKDCFMIDTAYLGGPILSWLCPQFGVVAEKFDHGGTPFGYHAVLMKYSIRTPP